SHVQVSSYTPVPSPPKRKVFPMAWSKTMPKSARFAGESVGKTCVHVDPSQIHVSSRYAPPVNPPKSTICRRTASYTMPGFRRAGGDVTGNCFRQFRPSHVHVSFR